jgi:hypothetical protein
MAERDVRSAIMLCLAHRHFTTEASVALRLSDLPSSDADLRRPE